MGFVVCEFLYFWISWLVFWMICGFCVVWVGMIRYFGCLLFYDGLVVFAFSGVVAFGVIRLLVCVLDSVFGVVLR